MHFSCLVQDIHQAAPPWCSTASVSLSKPSPSLDSPPTSKVDSCTVSYPKPYHSPVHPRGSESSPISPRFERNSTFSLPFIPRRPISGRRVDLLLVLPLLSFLEFIILDNAFSSTRIASRDFPSLPLRMDSLNSFLNCSILSRYEVLSR